jgi:hypothetical protein
MPIKGRTRALLERVGRVGTRTRTGARRRPLAPSPVWTLVTPYCKRTRPGRGTNTKATGFPPLSRRSPAASLSPLRARPRARPIWAGARGDIHSSAQGPPGLGTPTSIPMKKLSADTILYPYSYPWIGNSPYLFPKDNYPRLFTHTHTHCDP